MPKLRVEFRPQAWDEYTTWFARDIKIAKKIMALVDDIRRSPFNGIGKPEPLRHEYQGYCSRRIDDEHRLIYRVPDEDTVIIFRCHGDYDD